MSEPRAGARRRYVIFDYGNVISHPPPPEEVALFARAVECSVTDFAAAYWAHRPGYDLGETDAASYWLTVGAGLGRSLSPADIAALIRLDVSSWLHLNAGTVELAADLAAAGHRLCLLSNAPAELAEAVQRLPLARAFGHCLFSCQVGLVKPDPAIFRAALARLGASPAEAVFLDDRPENIAGAQAVGITAVRFTSPGQARAALARLGVVCGEDRGRAGQPATTGHSA